MFVLYALLWAPVSFLLHTTIHEGAHAFVAKLAGGRVTYFWPFPSKRLGYFTWAHVSLDGVPAKHMAAVCAAPVFAEVFWLAGAISGLLLTDGVLRWLFVVEVISANVDIVNWWRKLFQTPPDQTADAVKVAQLLGDASGLKRLVGVHLAILIAIAGIFLRVFA